MFFIFIIRVFHWNMRGKLRNPVFGNFLYRLFILVRDLIKFEICFFIIIRVFHWNIRGKLRNPVFGNILYRFFILVRDLIKFEIVVLSYY